MPVRKTKNVSLSPEIEALIGGRTIVRSEAGMTSGGFSAGGGTMEGLIRTCDWVATPLGPAEA
jgi:hypothetical protein